MRVTDIDAYARLFRGRAAAFRLTRDGNLEAQRLFQKAIGRDPDCATAKAFLAMMHLQTHQFGWVSAAADGLAAAYDCAEAAIDTDGSLPAAHVAMANVMLWQKRHADAAVAAETALAIDSNNAGAYEAMAAVDTWSGQAEDAIPRLKWAMRLDRLNSFLFLFGLGHAYFCLGRYEDAISALLRGTIRNPDFPPCHLYVAASHAQLREPAGAQGALRRWQALQPGISQSALSALLPYRQTADIDRLCDGLDRAGLGR